MLLGLRFDWLAHCQCTGQFLCERDHGFPGDRGGRSGGYGLGAAVFCLHGWEIAVKPNFQNQNFFFFFLLYFNMYTMCNSTTFALRHTQISLSVILRHFRLPSRHLLLHTHDTNMEFLQLSGPLLDIFLFFSKTKIFHSHPCACERSWLSWVGGGGVGGSCVLRGSVLGVTVQQFI